jgi:hypothetical protein
MKPNGEKILDLLIELYAKQMGVKIKYIKEQENEYSTRNNDRT